MNIVISRIGFKVWYSSTCVNGNIKWTTEPSKIKVFLNLQEAIIIFNQIQSLGFQVQIETIKDLK